jgi:hypothetical protein
MQHHNGIVLLVDKPLGAVAAAAAAAAAVPQAAALAALAQ